MFFFDILTGHFTAGYMHSPFLFQLYQVGRNGYLQFPPFVVDQDDEAQT